MLKDLLERDQISPEFKWHLEDIYENETLWEEDYLKADELLNKIIKFKGKLDNAEVLYNCLCMKDDINKIVEKLFVYARMRRDEDNTNSKYQALAQKAMGLMVKASSAMSFIEPEITSSDENVINNFLQENSNLQLYDKYLNDLIRMKKHILSKEEENILALAGEVLDSAHQIFSMLNDADLKFPAIKDENGQEIEITKGRFIKLLKSYDRNVRKEAFEKLYSTYKSCINTIEATYNANIKKDVFYAKVRKYSSSIEKALDVDNIPVEVYNSLIDVVNNNLDVLHRYIKIRKKVLNLDELHMYDLYVPLIPNINRKISYSQAKEMVLNGLKPLGDQYIDLLEQGFNGGWIDVYENRGKTGGAYSWGCYGVHPYVLLNFQETLDDVFTLAHEMGHAIHTYYSFNTQPYIYADYSIFVAEVASTLNEIILSKYLIDNAVSKKEKLYIINHYLEEFRATVIRQTMFAEFEKIVHQMAENDIPLTNNEFCKIYYDLNKKYFGEDVVIDEQISYEWARIPHFYRSFYVFKYATSFSAATSISKYILEGNKKALENYIQFLKSGSSKYPIEILKKANVDMTTKKPVEDAFEQFNYMLNQFESLL